MKLKRCVKPGCARVFNEKDDEFHDGFCDCGAFLENYTSEPISSNEPVVENLEETDNEEITADSSQLIEEESNEKKIGWEEEEEEETAPILVTKGTNSQSYAEEKPEDGPLYIIAKDGSVFYQGESEYTEELAKQDTGSSKDEFAEYTGDRILIYWKGEVYKTIPLQFDEQLIGRESNGEIPDIDFTQIDEERFISRKHALIYRKQDEYMIRNLSSKNTVHVNKLPLLEKQESILEDNSTIILSSKYGLLFKRGKDGDKVWQ